MKRLTIGIDACTETLALLVTMAWADGVLEDSERAGVRAASEVLNLTKDLRARLDAFLEKPLPADQLLVDTLSPRDRAFAFVAAAWLARLDARVDPKEEALLDEIATRLGFSHERKAELVTLAADLAKPGQESQGLGGDIVALFRAIAPRLEASGDTYEVTFE